MDQPHLREKQGPRPTATRRITNLMSIADDPSVNNFARSICGEAARYLSEPGLRQALEKAVEVIQQWHDMGGNEGVWDIYWQNAPEMKLIRETLERTK